MSENLIGFKQNVPISEVNISWLYTSVLFEAGPKLTYLFLQKLNCGTRRLALNFRFICLLKRAQSVYFYFKLYSELKLVKVTSTVFSFFLLLL